MSIPTTVVSEQEWDAVRETLLVKDKQLTCARVVRRHDEYASQELAGGRS
jgi:predicted dithiol-disulfide oxidoreductase (DUF899 family)